MSGSKVHPGGADAATAAELARLRQENAFLLKRLGSLSTQERELIQARHQLDEATRRFRRMQKFIRQGVQTETRVELAWFSCEAIMDILECEAGMLWCLSCPQSHDSLYTAPGVEVSDAKRDDLLVWAEACRNTAEGEPLPALPDSMGMRESLVERIPDTNGDTMGILIAANSWSKGAFHDPLDESSARTFAALAELVGAIMESRRRREIITDQVRIIQLSEQRLSHALDAGGVGLWEWEIGSDSVYYSPQWKRQLGYADDEIGPSFSEWQSRLHPDDRAQAMEKALDLTKKKRGTYHNLFRLRHRNGSWRWIVAKGFLLDSDQDGPRRAIGIHIDVTAYKQLETKLTAAKNQAVRASEAKSGFLAKLSHEIRTPLNGMLGTFQLLQGMPLSAAHRRLVELGESSGRWMLQIIGESLDLARIEAGKLELVESTFEPRQLVSELLTVKTQNAAAKGLKLDWTVHPDVPLRLHGDAVRIRQVLANLIGNAIKFTDHGSVSIDWSPQSSRRPAGRASYRITVKDTGIGIPPELAESVFQPFQQVDPSDHRRAGGIGLGLSITRELLGMMGGTIRHQTRSSGGSRFIVRLPLATVPVDGGHAPGDRLASKGFRGKVLVVEDDPISRELATLMLERQGLEVTTAADGAEGLNRLLENDFDLALVDCWMPQLDGLELTRQLRLQGQGKRALTPIVALTANTQASDVDACHAAGMNGYLSKPLLGDALVNMLSRFLKIEPEMIT